jgi:hypothetical protein
MGNFFKFKNFYWLELAFSGSFAVVKRGYIQTRLGTVMHSSTKIFYQNMRKNFL